MNESSTFLIIVVILVFCVALLLIFYIYNREKEKTYSLVIETSDRYNAILALNNTYNFHDVSSIFYYGETVNSRSKCERYDLNKLLFSCLNENGCEIKEIMKKNDANSLLFKKYSHAQRSLPPLTSPQLIKHMGLSYRLYHQIEAELCEQLILSPSVHFGIDCSVRYVSPKGRSNAYRHKLFDKSDIIAAFHALQEMELTQASRAYQRSLMSPSLRYSILQRDNFRCVLCGRSTRDDPDLQLEIDHIFPISKGGKTEAANLRTLCRDCNRGKSDSYNPDTVN